LTEAGTVIGAEVAKSSNAGFNDAALNAVMTWRYKPAMRQGRAVKVHLDVDVRFEMPQK
jgi:TonB family protein